MTTSNDICFWGDIPFLYEVDDADTWKDPDAPVKIHEIILEIKKSGYEGVDFNYAFTSNRRVIYAPLFDLNTHEGQLLAKLLEHAKFGIELPTLEQCMADLNQLYKNGGEHGN